VLNWLFLILLVAKVIPETPKTKPITNKVPMILDLIFTSFKIFLGGI